MDGGWGVIGKPGQVSCQVNDQEDLKRLGGLEVDPAATQPHARPKTGRVGAQEDCQGG